MRAEHLAIALFSPLVLLGRRPRLPELLPGRRIRGEQLRIGGNKKGQAVLSQDPELGPLDDLEISALLNALRAATKEGGLTLQEQAALWLCTAFGQIQRSRRRCAEDVVIIADTNGDPAFVHVDIPRIKKGDERHRTQLVAAVSGRRSATSSSP